MTKEELSRYAALSREIEKQERRKERLLSKRINDVEPDVVTGSMDVFPYIEKRFKITGVPVGLITMIEKDIDHSIQEAAEARIRIEKYINGHVDDPRMRELLRSRFIDCLSWAKVGRENYVSQNHARKLVSEFLKNKS